MTGSGDTAGGNQRQVVETLDVSKATATGGGNAFAYERIPGAVPPGAAELGLCRLLPPGRSVRVGLHLLHDRLIPERTHGQPMRKLILTLGATALLAAPAAASAADSPSPAAARLDDGQPLRRHGGPGPHVARLRHRHRRWRRGQRFISPIAPATLTGPTGAAVDVVNTHRRARRSTSSTSSRTPPPRPAARSARRRWPDQGLDRAVRRVQVRRSTRRAASSRSRSSIRSSTLDGARRHAARHWHDGHRSRHAVRPHRHGSSTLDLSNATSSSARTARARSRASSRSSTASTVARGLPGGHARPVRHDGADRLAVDEVIARHAAAGRRPPALRVPPARPARTRRSASSGSPRRRSRPRPRCTCA